MAHASPLILVLVAGFGLAFALGTLAVRLRLSPIAGYLLAGIAIGPFTPGFVADSHLTLDLAEIGVILLMFGVGLQFSPKELLAVRAIALPGALLQVLLSTAIGTGVAWMLGWPPLGGGLVIGIALSISSTIVTMRTLQERRIVDSERGHILAGWLVVQDIVTVLALVLLPALAPLLSTTPTMQTVSFAAVLLSLAFTLAKLAAFGALMWLVGRRIIPAVLHYVAHTGSRELFRLAVLSLALGVAFAASEIFGVSLALGAFIAGMILSESPLSQQAAAESLPLRDAFAVLFFVSVGMLFDPSTLVHAPFTLIATVLAVLLAISVSVFLLIRVLGGSAGTALFAAAALAQIGEFSFILMDLGLGLKLVPPDARNVVLGTSIVTILLNPALLAGVGYLLRRNEPAPSARDARAEALMPTALRDHAVVVGYGRVGSLVADELAKSGMPVLVIEEIRDVVKLRGDVSMEFLAGNAADERVLGAAGLKDARLLFVAIPQAFDAGQIVEQARAINPGLRIVARAHFDAETEHLMQHGADAVIMGEREIARAMLDFALLHGQKEFAGRAFTPTAPMRRPHGQPSGTADQN
ncbi:MAG: cation:proton antiporter [Alphaproteobacteria bacterium]|nr:cation:proton antiporter [Alphaproteobacteria bacterium]